MANSLKNKNPAVPTDNHIVRWSSNHVYILHTQVVIREIYTKRDCMSRPVISFVRMGTKTKQNVEKTFYNAENETPYTKVVS